MDTHRKWELVISALKTAQAVETDMASAHPPNSVHFQKHKARADEYARVEAWATANQKATTERP